MAGISVFGDSGEAVLVVVAAVGKGLRIWAALAIESLGAPGLVNESSRTPSLSCPKLSRRKSTGRTSLALHPSSWNENMSLKLLIT